MHPLEKIVSFVIALVYTNLRVFTYCRRIQIIGFCGNSVCFHSFTLFCKPYKMRCFGNLLFGQFPGKKSITKVNVGLYYRRSNRSCFVKKTVLKIFAKFTEISQNSKAPVPESFFSKTTGSLLKKGLWGRLFSEHFFMKHLRRLLLLLYKRLLINYLISDVQKQPQEMLCRKKLMGDDQQLY